MSNTIVLVNKEFVQMVRDYKIIWLPLVFIFLGATQPLVTHYLPTILDSVGGGQGITIDPSMTAQKGGEVLASTLSSQFDQLGMMIIVLSMMGVIQADKASGMLHFILTRPVSVQSYIGGKITANYLFVSASVAIGYIISYLYVNHLFSNVPFGEMLTALFFYLVWVLFIVSFTAMVSTIFNSQSLIALISIAFLLGCKMLTGLGPMINVLNPGNISNHAINVLMTGSVNSTIVKSLFVALVWIALTLFITNYWIANKKYDIE